MKILLVEDEVRLSEAIAHILQEDKHSVDAVYNGEDGYNYIMSGVYDLVILDVNLPIYDGFEVLQKIRVAGNKTLILMLTARTEIGDKVMGLDLGADDYLAKPFATRELLARIHALNRRSGGYEGEIKKIGDILYDVNTNRLSRNKKSVTLTHLEGQLLELLMARKQMITSKENIIIKLWGYDSEAEDNHVEVYISFLRKKLKYISSNVIIKTTRNVGYSLEDVSDV